MSKAETAVGHFANYNCAQSVLLAYCEDFGLDKEKALQTAVGFGAGFGRHQDICGAISGAIIVLGLSSQFKEEDRRPKITETYAKVYEYVKEFKENNGCVDCLELLDGCDLKSEEGQKAFRENNMREKCFDYVRFCCNLLDKHLKIT